MRLNLGVTCGLVLTLSGLSGSVLASPELAAKTGCLGCHTVERKVVGPSYQDVAKKYASQKDAEAYLASSIKSGGSGKWGVVPMPAQSQLSDVDALILAKWVLTQVKK